MRQNLPERAIQAESSKVEFAHVVPQSRRADSTRRPEPFRRLTTLDERLVAVPELLCNLLRLGVEFGVAERVERPQLGGTGDPGAGPRCRGRADARGRTETDDRRTAALVLVAR